MRGRKKQRGKGRKKISEKETKSSEDGGEDKKREDKEERERKREEIFDISELSNPLIREEIVNAKETDSPKSTGLKNAFHQSDIAICCVEFITQCRSLACTNRLRQSEKKISSNASEKLLSCASVT